MSRCVLIVTLSTQWILLLHDAHPDHVRSEGVDVVRVLEDAVAVLVFAQVERPIARLGIPLERLVRRLNVDRRVVGFQVASEDGIGVDLFCGNWGQKVGTRTGEFLR